MMDPEFLGDMAKRKVEISRPVTGVEIDAMIVRFAQPRSVVQKAIQLTDTTTMKNGAKK